MKNQALVPCGRISKYDGGQWLYHKLQVQTFDKRLIISTCSFTYEGLDPYIVDPGAAADIACPTQNALKTKRAASQKKIVLQVQIIEIYTGSK